MNNITLYDYLAYSDRNKAIGFLRRHGVYSKMNSYEDISRELRRYARKNREDGLFELIEIHPDKELFSHTCKSCKDKDMEIETLSKDKNHNNNDDFKNFMYMNAMNQNSRYGYFNADGNNGIGKSDEERIVNRVTYNAFIVGGFLLLGVALLMKTQKS